MSFYWWVYSPIFILLGILMLNPKIYKSMISLGNEMKGVPTKITKSTLIFGKILGLVFLAIGLLFLIFALIGYKI